MSTGAGPVDWSAAARIAGRLAPPGPVADHGELTALVDELRASAARAAAHVVETTRMDPGRPAAELSQVLVVDRPGWARANTQLFAVMAEPLLESHPQASAAARLGSAAQVGAVLALLAGKVLGQFDPFTAPGQGRLLLVAPNVLHHERTLGVDPSDFRLWVALHEQTHALQFAAAPWLAGHVRSRSAELLEGFTHDDEDSLADLFSSVARALTGPGGGVLGVLDERQRAVFDEVSGIMALLEGHADVTMDAVGPSVVPSVGHIRRKFEAKRDSSARSRGLERVLRRVLGMDLKLAQYRDGAAFVRGARARVGVAAFNAVWAGPENLPTADEIHDPGAWVRRVHG